ncbi:hypothetical protein V6Z12_A09G022000 [Gossypium hirsutum]
MPEQCQGVGSHERFPRTVSFMRASPRSFVRMILQKEYTRRGQANRIQQMIANKMYFYFLFFSVNLAIKADDCTYKWTDTLRTLYAYTYNIHISNLENFKKKNSVKVIFFILLIFLLFLSIFLQVFFIIWFSETKRIKRQVLHCKSAMDLCPLR